MCACRSPSTCASPPKNSANASPSLPSASSPNAIARATGGRLGSQGSSRQDGHRCYITNPHLQEDPPDRRGTYGEVRRWPPFVENRGRANTSGSVREETMTATRRGVAVHIELEGFAN